ncbi:MAG: holo-ACP synthase [Idiomarina sp.]
MAIFGIGTDIVEVKRIGQSLQRSDALARRVLTAVELEQFAEAAQPVGFLAKRFAAKEACAKAFGTGIGERLSFQDITIGHDAAGRPILLWSTAAENLTRELGINASHVSISDEREYALAYVILETLGS